MSGSGRTSARKVTIDSQKLDEKKKSVFERLGTGSANKSVVKVKQSKKSQSGSDEEFEGEIKKKSLSSIVKKTSDETKRSSDQEEVTVKPKKKKKVKGEKTKVKKGDLIDADGVSKKKKKSAVSSPTTGEPLKKKKKNQEEFPLKKGSTKQLVKKKQAGSESEAEETEKKKKKIRKEKTGDKKSKKSGSMSPVKKKKKSKVVEEWSDDGDEVVVKKKKKKKKEQSKKIKRSPTHDYSIDSDEIEMTSDSEEEEEEDEDEEEVRQKRKKKLREFQRVNSQEREFNERQHFLNRQRDLSPKETFRGYDDERPPIDRHSMSSDRRRDDFSRSKRGYESMAGFSDAEFYSKQRMDYDDIPPSQLSWRNANFEDLRSYDDRRPLSNEHVRDMRYADLRGGDSRGRDYYDSRDFRHERNWSRDYSVDRYENSRDLQYSSRDRRPLPARDSSGGRSRSRNFRGSYGQYDEKDDAPQRYNRSPPRDYDDYPPQPPPPPPPPPPGPPPGSYARYPPSVGSGGRGGDFSRESREEARGSREDAPSRRSKERKFDLSPIRSATLIGDVKLDSDDEGDGKKDRKRKHEKAKKKDSESEGSDTEVKKKKMKKTEGKEEERLLSKLESKKKEPVKEKEKESSKIKTDSSNGTDKSKPDSKSSEKVKIETSKDFEKSKSDSKDSEKTKSENKDVDKNDRKPDGSKDENKSKSKDAEKSKAEEKFKKVSKSDGEKEKTKEKESSNEKSKESNKEKDKKKDESKKKTEVKKEEKDDSKKKKDSKDESAKKKVTKKGRERSIDSTRSEDRDIRRYNLDRNRQRSPINHPEFRNMRSPIRDVNSPARSARGRSPKRSPLRFDRRCDSPFKHQSPYRRSQTPRDNKTDNTPKRESYEPVSDEDLDMFDDESQAKPAPVTEVDWTLLQSFNKKQQTKKKDNVVPDFMRRLSSGNVLNDIGYSPALLAPEDREKVQRACLQSKGIDYEALDAGEKDKLQAGIASSVSKLLKNHSLREELFNKNLIGLRNDLSLRRDLRKPIDKLSSTATMFCNAPSQPAHIELFTSSVQMYNNTTSPSRQPVLACKS